MPERMIAHDPEFFLFTAQFRGLKAAIFEAEAYADYVACGKDPAVIHGMCEGYRAGAGYDRRLEDEDKAPGRKVAAPGQDLWGRGGARGAWHGELDPGRDAAPAQRSQALD